MRVSKLLGLDPSPSHQVEDPSQVNTNTNTKTNDENTDADANANNGYARAPDGYSGQTAAAPSGPPVDLLGGLEEEEGVVGGGVVAGEGAAAATTTAGSRATRVEVDMVDLFDGGGVAGGEKGLDDFLGLGDSTAPAPVAPAPAAPSASTAGNDVSVDPPESSLFEDLSVKDAGRGSAGDGGAEGVGGEDRGPAPKLASGGSGFAFMAGAEEASPEGERGIEAGGGSAGPAQGGERKVVLRTSSNVMSILVILICVFSLLEVSVYLVCWVVCV